MRLHSRCLYVLVLTAALAGRASAQQLVDDVSHANAITHYRIGEELLHDEQFAKAAEEFQVAVKFDPLLTIAHYELGQAFMALRQYREAIRGLFSSRPGRWGVRQVRANCTALRCIGDSLVTRHQACYGCTSQP